MSNHLKLIAAVFTLYLISSLVLQAMYGQSYGFMAGDNCWIADNKGGWMALGEPTDPMPTEPSLFVPLIVHYIPIFLPTALLVLFLFTPLNRKLNPKRPESEFDEGDGEEPPTEDQ